jgi:succinate dehydrogenase/fumarate reductase cytochrome b subunit
MMKEKLIELNACAEALEWAGDKTWEEIYNTCHRGDWLLWLFAKTNPDDFRLLTLAKAHCVNTVRHLMMDKRSKNAVDVAIAFGEGRATIEELNATYNAANAAYHAAYNTGGSAGFAACAASYVALGGVCAAFAAAAYCAACAAATAAAGSAGGAASAYVAAEKESQKLTADVCRKYLPIEIWNV